MPESERNCRIGGFLTQGEQLGERHEETYRSTDLWSFSETDQRSVLQVNYFLPLALMRLLASGQA